MRDVRRLRASTFLTKGKSRNDSAARQCWLTENCRIGAHLAGRLNGVAYSQYYIGLSRASPRAAARQGQVLIKIAIEVIAMTIITTWGFGLSRCFLLLLRTGRYGFFLAAF